jgi:hypothetical protein
MKSPLLIVIAILLVTASCKKTNSVLIREPAYFAFGYQDSLCVNCNSIHPMSGVYLLKDTSLYLSHNKFVNDSAGFSTTPLATNQYQMAMQLSSNFPAFLLNAPDSTYGWPPSPQQRGGYLILALRNSGVERQWLINRDTAQLPIQLRPFIARVLQTIHSL